MAAVTRFVGSYHDQQVAPPAESGWLAQSRELLPECREHPFQSTVPRWADPRVYAVLLTAVCFYVVFGLFW